MRVKALLHRLKELDTLSKLAIIINFAVVTYVILLFALKPLLIPTNTELSHNTVMGDHMMTFSSPEQSQLNIFAIVGAMIVATAITLLAKNEVKHEINTAPRRSSSEELSIIKKALSADEKKLIETIEEAGEITQDSLRFLLEWSKAKVSTLVTNLEKINIIQRKREGKTYVVFIQKRTSAKNEIRE